MNITGSRQQFKAIKYDSCKKAIAGYYIIFNILILFTYSRVFRSMLHLSDHLIIPVLCAFYPSLQAIL